MSGLSSGEGLIAQVRDPIDTSDTDAPTDKRRLVVEAEFAQVMKVLAREGNTLSPVVRNAWDGKRLQTISRNSPLQATDAHIGIIGHITKDELLRYLAATELANGFFNRFLVIAVQRSKLLPLGGQLSGQELDHVRDRVGAALRHHEPRLRCRSPTPRASAGSPPTQSYPPSGPGCTAPRPRAPKPTPHGSR